MIEASAIANCPWQEPGGAEAAQSICTFLQDIGIELEIAPTGEDTFVPGLAISNGRILVDPAIASYPGDLLHEAGHIAVVLPEARETLCEVGNDGGDEMAAIAWSVAAAHASGTPLDIIFHPVGYKGNAEALIENFSNGCPLGVPLLNWYGLTEQARYPEMDRWLR